MTNLLIRRADSSSAQAWAYLVLTSNDDGQPAVVATGFYMCTLKHSKSEWRIAELLVGLDSAS